VGTEKTEGNGEKIGGNTDSAVPGYLTRLVAMNSNAEEKRT